MSIALVGSHRTGKSTLAADYSAAVGVPFVRTSAAGTFERLGLDPKAEYPLAARVKIQNAILDDAQAIYAQHRGVYVTDRSPLDMAAYMLADVQRTSLVGKPDLAHAVQEFVNRCYDVTNRHFTLLFVVQPGIPVVEEEGKAPGEAAFMEHMNALMLGLASSELYQGVHYYLPRKIIDREQRVTALTNAYTQSVLRARNNLELVCRERGLQVH